MKTAHAAIAAVAIAAIAAFAQERDPDPARSRPEVGSLAPEIRLNDHEGHAVQVGGESEGYTVLAFYPKAMTPG